MEAGAAATRGISVVEFPRGKKAIASPYNAIAEGCYAEPATGQHFRVTAARTGQILEAAPAEPEWSRGPRTTLQTLLDEYCSRHYKNGVARAFSVKEQPYQAALVIMAELTQDFSWKGEWCGVHVFEVLSTTEAKLTSNLTLQVQYHEEWPTNVVFDHHTAVDLTASDLTALYAAALAEVQRQDTALHSHAMRAGGVLDGGRLKLLRRRLPLTRDLFDFTSSQHLLRPTLPSITEPPGTTIG
eukprot:EG_transcript_24222